MPSRMAGSRSLQMLDGENVVVYYQKTRSIISPAAFSISATEFSASCLSTSVHSRLKVCIGGISARGRWSARATAERSNPLDGRNDDIALVETFARFDWPTCATQRTITLVT